MLDAFIIEEIQRRERERDTRIQPHLERFPMPPPSWRPDSRRDPELDRDDRRDDDMDQGVIILDMQTPGAKKASAQF